MFAYTNIGSCQGRPKSNKNEGGFLLEKKRTFERGFKQNKEIKIKAVATKVV
jgi:hypothetical protein